jgi:hypothetical protein
MVNREAGWLQVRILPSERAFSFRKIASDCYRMQATAITKQTTNNFVCFWLWPDVQKISESNL